MLQLSMYVSHSLPWPRRARRQDGEPDRRYGALSRRAHGAELADLRRRAGEVVHTTILERRPVEEYLKLQGRFRHFFEPTVQRDAIAHIQRTVAVDAHWTQVDTLNERREPRNLSCGTDSLRLNSRRSF